MLPTIIALLSLFIALTRFALDEWRRIKEKRKEEDQRKEEQTKNGAYPPRKDKHRR